MKYRWINKNQNPFINEIGIKPVLTCWIKAFIDCCTAKIKLWNLWNGWLYWFYFSNLLKIGRMNEHMKDRALLFHYFYTLVTTLRIYESQLFWSKLSFSKTHKPNWHTYDIFLRLSILINYITKVLQEYKYVPDFHIFPIPIKYFGTLEQKFPIWKVDERLWKRLIFITASSLLALY